MASEPHTTTVSTPPRRRRPQIGDDGRRLGTAGHALVVSVLALLFGALLSAPGLHKSATGLQPGPERDVVLALTGALADVSGVLQLDEPRALVQAAIGRSGDDEIDTTVVVPVAPKPAAKPSAHVVATPSPAQKPTEPAKPAKVAFSPTKKLRLWIAGDSLVITPGYAIVRATQATPVMQSVGGVDGRVATGLERPDVFNWFTEIASEVKKLKPNVVILLFGGNDDHSYMTGLPEGTSIGEFGSASWKREYARRVGGVMDTIARAGGHTIWIGLPITRSPSQTQRFDIINAVVQQQASQRPRTATYLDTYTTFAGEDGGYAQYLHDRRGRLIEARADDGVHFERAGGDMIARMVLERLNELYDLTSWRTRAG